MQNDTNKHASLTRQHLCLECDRCLCFARCNTGIKSLSRGGEGRGGGKGRGREGTVSTGSYTAERRAGLLLLLCPGNGLTWGLHVTAPRTAGLTVPEPEPVSLSISHSLSLSLLTLARSVSLTLSLLTLSFYLSLSLSLLDYVSLSVSHSMCLSH